MARVIVLAKNVREAGSFAALMGIPRGQYRAAQNASSIKGVRRAEVYLLPSFLARRDRHAIMSALRNARNLEVYYVDPADLIASLPKLADTLPVAYAAAQAEQAEKLGPLTEEQLELAHIMNDYVHDPDGPGEATPASNALETGYAELAKDPETPRTRRKKCPDCDELFPKEEFDAHVETHKAAPPAADFF